MAYPIKKCGLLTDSKGAALTEYGMLIALVAAATIATVAFMGREIGSDFENITSSLSSMRISIGR